MKLIQDSSIVTELCQTWQQLDYVVLDTEFMRSDTYYADLSLVQIRAGEELILIDPYIDGMREALLPLLSDRGVIKVLHAGSEDLQILAQYCGEPIGPIFDTQVAAAFCNYGFSLSYAKLVARLCSVELEKGETRSDWSRRPLSDSQLRYAADDVLYLADVYEQLCDTLLALGRLEWVTEECALMETAASSEVLPEQAYLKVGRAWQLAPRNLLVLQELACWREQTAVERNRPRSWIVKDRTLWEIAHQLPQDNESLANVEGLAAGQIRRSGETILKMVGDALSAEEHKLPQRLPQPAGKAYSKVSKMLRASVLTLAERMKIAPEMLARKKDIEYLLQTHNSEGSAELPASLAGWRANVIGLELQRTLNGFFDKPDSQTGKNG